MANPTAEDIIGRARSLLKAEGGSDVPVIQDEFMLTALSDGNLKWAEAFQGNGSAPIVFLREFGKDLPEETQINDAAGTTTATTTITADDTTDYDTAGVGIVWDDASPDIFSYTAKTATSFTGVTGLGFDHEDNDFVQPMIALPSTFGKVREGGLLLNGYPLEPVGARPQAGHYALYDDGTTQYVWLPRGSSGTLTVLYDKNSTTIDSIDDTVDVPTIHQFFLIWHLVAFAYVGRENDFSRMLAAQAESEKVLMRALRHRNTNKKIRPRSFGRASGDYTVINGRYVPLS